jgi:hypothetical protein
VRWPRHIRSLRAFGVRTHGLDGPRSRRTPTDRPHLLRRKNRPAAVAAAFIASPEFKADMAGFIVDNIIDVEEILLDPAAASPLS